MADRGLLSDSIVPFTKRPAQFSIKGTHGEARHRVEETLGYYHHTLWEAADSPGMSCQAHDKLGSVLGIASPREQASGFDEAQSLPTN